MLVKIYEMLWAIIALIAILLLVTGNFSMMTLVAFGFVCFGMIFMGMMSVLPSTVGHHAPLKTAEAKIEKAKEEKGLFPSKHLAIR